MNVLTRRVGLACAALLAAMVAPAGGAAAAAGPAVVAATTFPGTITDEQWKVFVRAVAARADPPLPLKMMIRGELGAEEAMVAAARRGRVQIAATSLAGTSQTVPELAVLALPYLFDTTEQMDALLAGVVPAAIAPLFDARGLVFLDWIDSGWVGLYAQDPLTEPGQLAGYKLRTPAVLAAQAMAQVLQADAVYIPYPDIIPTLQTGLIRGGITADYPFFTGGIDAEARYFIYTRHTYDVGAILANKAWFDSLSPANRAIVRTAWGDSAEFRARTRAYTAAAMAKLPAKGTEVVELTPEQRARWASATRPVHAKVLEQLGPGAQALYDAIAAAKAEWARAHAP